MQVTHNEAYKSLRYLPYAANNAFPLDMTQFKNLFHSTRIPRPEIDEIKLASTPQRHLIVIHKGKVFTVDAFDSKWNVRDERDIIGDLEAILEEGRGREIVDSVCTLTTLDRNTWAEVSSHLLYNVLIAFVPCLFKLSRHEHIYKRLEIMKHWIRLTLDYSVLSCVIGQAIPFQQLQIK